MNRILKWQECLTENLEDIFIQIYENEKKKRVRNNNSHNSIN